MVGRLARPGGGAIEGEEPLRTLGTAATDVHIVSCRRLGGEHGLGRDSFSEFNPPISLCCTQSAAAKRAVRTLHFVGHPFHFGFYGSVLLPPPRR